MRCFSLLLGARNTGSSNGRFLRRDDVKVRSITARHFRNGFTVLRSSGGWYDSLSGRFKTEASRQIIICGASFLAVQAWAVELAKALQQRELIVMESGRAHAIHPRLPRAHRARGATRRKPSQ